MISKTQMNFFMRDFMLFYIHFLGIVFGNNLKRTFLEKMNETFHILSKFNCFQFPCGKTLDPGQ